MSYGGAALAAMRQHRREGDACASFAQVSGSTPARRSSSARSCLDRLSVVRGPGWNLRRWRASPLAALAAAPPHGLRRLFGPTPRSGKMCVMHSRAGEGPGGETLVAGPPPQPSAVRGAKKLRHSEGRDLPRGASLPSRMEWRQLAPRAAFSRSDAPGNSKQQQPTHPDDKRSRSDLHASLRTTTATAYAKGPSPPRAEHITVASMIAAIGGRPSWRSSTASAA